MIVLLDSLTTYNAIQVRKRYLLREGSIDLFGNAESFFTLAKRSRALRKKKHKLYTIVLSFSVNDKLTLKRVKDITLFWLKHFFCGYRIEEISFSGVVHTDTENLHIHLTVANLFLPTGSYLYFYNHCTDFTFLNQLNRYIEERFNLTPAFRNSKAVSYPSLLLSRVKKGKGNGEISEFLTFIESLNRSLEQGIFTSLEDFLTFLKRGRFKPLYHKFYKDIPLGETAFRVGEEIFKVRGVGLHPLFYTTPKKKLKRFFSFDRELFEKTYKRRFKRIYKRRKGSLKRLRKFTFPFYLRNSSYYDFLNSFVEKLGKGEEIGRREQSLTMEVNHFFGNL